MDENPEIKMAKGPKSEKFASEDIIVKKGSQLRDKINRKIHLIDTLYSHKLGIEQHKETMNKLSSKCKQLKYITTIFSFHYCLESKYFYGEKRTEIKSTEWLVELNNIAQEL